MNIYGVTLVPLCKHLKEVIPEVMLPVYADDVLGTGEASTNARVLAFLVKHGPNYGYFAEPEKSV